MSAGDKVTSLALSAPDVGIAAAALEPDELSRSGFTSGIVVSVVARFSMGVRGSAVGAVLAVEPARWNSAFAARAITSSNASVPPTADSNTTG